MDHGDQRGRRRPAITACCALVFLSAAVPAFSMGFDTGHFDVDVAVSSDYVVHGVTRSQGKPIMQAQVGWTGESGWMAGTWMTTVDLNRGRGPNRELDPYIAKRWLMNRDWSLRTDITRYIFRPELTGAAYDYTELRGAFSYRDIVDVAVAWSPDYSGYSWRGGARNRTMLTYEASGHFPATRWLGLNAGVGRRDLQDVFGTSYWYWSAGTEATLFRRVSVALTYIGSSAEATDLYGAEYAGDRFVATVSMRVR
jgi:uncharacterized protein (TIGR02001 family)